MTNWVAVHVITRLELGGAQLATLYEAQHSAFAAASPRYLIYGPGGLLDPEAGRLADVCCLPAPALTRALMPGRDLQACMQVVSLLRQVRQRHRGAKLLVHTHSSKAGIIGRWAARAVAADCVVHSIHGFGYQPRSMSWPHWRSLWLAERLTAPFTHGFTGDSAANLAQARRDGIIGRQTAAVVRCGIDVDAFARPTTPPASVRVALRVPDHHQLVLMVACLKPQKNPLAFVRLAAAIQRTLGDVATFVIAGDGELRAAMTAAAQTLGVTDHVRLLGWRRDIPDLLHACDLLVLTSLWEGLPQVFPQAMAASKPIVATAVDGAPEAIESGHNGLLVPPCNDEAMAAATRTLLGDALLRQRMGAAGRARVEEFSQAHMINQLDKFYTEVTAAVH